MILREVFTNSCGRFVPDESFSLVAVDRGSASNIFVHDWKLLDFAAVSCTNTWQQEKLCWVQSVPHKMVRNAINSLSTMVFSPSRATNGSLFTEKSPKRPQRFCSCSDERVAPRLGSKKAKAKIADNIFSTCGSIRRCIV
jgi:hypothetical protein